MLLAMAGLHAAVEALQSASGDVAAAMVEVRDELALIREKLGAGLPGQLDNGRLRVKSGGN